jgi:hypothetical protein
MRPEFAQHALSCLVAGILTIGTADAIRAEAQGPIKLALFDFELEDASAGAGLGESARDFEYLARATDVARRLVAQSGRYSLVETTNVDAGAVKEHWLRKCDGCEAPIAGKLGAEQALLGIVHRVSRTEYWIRYQIRDARTGGLVSTGRTELRLGADYSWDRGARWLVENRLLASKDRP